MFVDIHPFELNRLSVEQQYGVRLSVTGNLVDRFDFDAAETNVRRNDFRYFAVFLYRHQQFVKIRMFSTPGGDIVQLFFKRSCLDTVGSDP